MGNTVANTRRLNRAIALIDRDGLTVQEAANAVGVKVEVLQEYINNRHHHGNMHI